MRVLLSLALIVALLSMNVSASEPAEPAAPDEERREYVLGGSASGTQYSCWHSLPFDFGAACDIRCPGNTCNITVIDDVRGTNIGFRICFDGETFCRPNGYWGTANVPGSKVTVVPSASQATHGIVIVR